MEVTIAIQIGNSDDKLSQKDWAEFVAQYKLVINTNAEQVHFFGASSNWEVWQNAAWIFNIKEQNITDLVRMLSKIRKDFNQDSTAWLQGKTEFI